MNIVLGFSTRPEGRAALVRAVEEARLRSARLIIVRTMVEEPSESPASTRAWADSIEQARSAGIALAAQLQEQGVEAVFKMKPIGSSPADAILEVARSEAADLIVIGIRKRSPVGKLVLGSVSQDVVLRAECPVLAVKATPVTTL